MSPVKKNKSKARVLQFCGTGSGVGKSVLTAAFCRIFLQDGFRVCPFKAQNMALNSFVTRDGCEIGRAQAVQAEAARIEPTSDMNPVLMKPSSDRKAQIIVKGKPIDTMSVYEYVKYKKNALRIVEDSFQKLSENYEMVVIEGAGSPAEINLRAHDIVNMTMARHAKAPVILVGDIDKGGVFAWFVGTLELLTKEERKMVKGFIINKFRGDKRLLKPAIAFLEKKTGIKVLGVIPYFHEIKIPEEDSVPIDERKVSVSERSCREKRISIAVIKLPHLSNFTDFDALEKEPDVRLSYYDCSGELGKQDVIILPGTKSTVSDLQYLKKTGMADRILHAMKKNQQLRLIGICGGYQMLGQRICDPDHTESDKDEVFGFGLLPVTTSFEKKKILTQVEAREIASGLEVKGYEIHHGRTRIQKEGKPVFLIRGKGGKMHSDGALSEDGRIWGTYMHGVFDSDSFRRDFLNRIRREKGWNPLNSTRFSQDGEFDKLAHLVRTNTDMKQIYRILTEGIKHE